MKVNIDGVEREIISCKATVDGVVRDLDRVYASVDGVQREIFSRNAAWKKYSVRSYFIDGTTATNITAYDAFNFKYLSYPAYNSNYKESGTVDTIATGIPAGQYFVYNGNDYKSGGTQSGGFVIVGYKVSGYSTQQGDYIETVTADAPDAYPADGVHTDGYWYVRV